MKTANDKIMNSKDHTASHTDSGIDFKSVFEYSAEDFVLQRYTPEHIQTISSFVPVVSSGFHLSGTLDSL